MSLRLADLFDNGEYESLPQPKVAQDPLKFRDSKKYIDRLRDSCDAVVLGCTELPLVLGDANATLPTLDSTRLLAKAALRRAMS